MLAEGVELIKQIISIGINNNIKNPEAYIVGGAVRDMIIGNVNLDEMDIDISTNVPISILDNYLETYSIGSNKDFGILVVLSNGFDFEVAQYRSDGEYTDGRHPDTIEIVSDSKEDAKRRDFTINSLYVDDEGNIIDYFDGQKDIKNKVIRTVGDAHKRFDEDYIRMLRAVRFASRLDFDIEDETMKAIKDNAVKLESIAPERIMKEVYKMAKQDGYKFAEAIVTMKDIGLLNVFLPEIVKMDEFEHEVEHHPEGNVFHHTIDAIRNTGSEDAIVNLATLLHDVGKIETHKLDEKGRHRYFGHDKRGSDMIEGIADRLKMSKKDKQSLQFAAKNHMKMHLLPEMKPSKIIKLINDDNWDVLETVALADAKARGDKFSEEEWGWVVDKIKAVKTKFSGSKDIAKIKKDISGKVVMDVLGITKGTREVGRIHRELIDWVINDNIDITNGDMIKDKIIELSKQ